MNNTYPAIQLNYVSESLSPYVDQIEYGVEEEGLFSVRTLIPASSLQEQTYVSTQTSKAGIALGVSEDLAFLMHRKAGPDRFILQKTPPSLTAKEGRLLGKNAARLVKGMPFCQE